METKYCIIGVSIKINNENEKYILHFIFHTLRSTYQIIKGPCNEKQCQHNISSYGETTHTQNIIPESALRKIYSSIY